jgi:hypothetical protein
MVDVIVYHHTPSHGHSHDGQVKRRRCRRLHKNTTIKRTNEPTNQRIIRKEKKREFDCEISS